MFIVKIERGRQGDVVNYLDDDTKDVKFSLGGHVIHEQKMIDHHVVVYEDEYKTECYVLMLDKFWGKLVSIPLERKPEGEINIRFSDNMLCLESESGKVEFDMSKPVEGQTSNNLKRF